MLYHVHRIRNELAAISEEVQQHWAAISPILSIRNEREYDNAIARLNLLLDEVSDNEQHPLYSLLDTLGTLVHAYEVDHYPLPRCSGGEALAFHMEEHNLTPVDLPEVGTEVVISDILAGTRELDLQQIRALAQRFYVAPGVFT